MKERIVLFIILFALPLSNVSYAQQTYKSECSMFRDTVFVQRTEAETYETYDLIHRVRGKNEVIYTLTTDSEGYIAFLFSFDEGGGKVYDSFANYNNIADGNSFLFFNRADRRLYITYGCYADFYPIPESVDFEKQTALLENKWSRAHNPTDTLHTGRNTHSIGYVGNIRIVTVKIKEVNDKKQ